MGQVNKFFFFNSKLKSKIGCYQIYLLKKKIKEITKTQENFYFFSKTKQVYKWYLSFPDIFHEKPLKMRFERKEPSQKATF